VLLPPRRSAVLLHQRWGPGQDSLPAGIPTAGRPANWENPGL